MSNSKLATYVRISPFKNSPRNKPISKITWHHMAGVLSVEQFGNIVTTPGREMSATYAIGYDGTIGRFLDESDRPWTSSSPANDNMAVTFEISNSKMGEPWPISDHVMDRAIELTVDVCKRNGIKKLIYTGDATGNFTFHCYFSPTGCPGTYIKSKAKWIVATVNKKLGATVTPSTPEPTTTSVKAKDLVSVKSNATYYDGSNMPSWVKSTEWYVDSVSRTRAVLGKSKDGKSNINSAVNTKYLTVIKTATTTTASTFKSYTAKINSGTAIYKSAGGSKIDTIKTTSVYTIIDEKTTNKIKYGKLKSGAGWVDTSKITKKITKTTTKSSTASTIKKGDKVKVLSNKTYDGGTFIIYESRYFVLDVSGKRAVISSDGKNVTAAVNTDNLKKI